MPKPSLRWKKKKKYKSRKGEARIAYGRRKTSKHKCALCHGVMHGMPHGKTGNQAGKLSKTERRPSALFAGTLCNLCRKQVIEEAVKVKAGLKEIGKVELRHKKFVDLALTKIE